MSREHPPLPHSRPTLGAEERQAVLDVLAGEHLANGPLCRQLEQALADAMGVRHGAMTSSGLTALHLAMLAMNVRPDDQVILPTYVCEALLDAVLHCQAQPVIVDVDAQTGNIDPAAARRAIGPQTKLIVVPHMFGTPAAMDELLPLGVPLLEDCATAIGARCGGRPVGSMGQAGIVSLYATKMLCAGEGGAVCGDDPTIIQKVADLRDYSGREDFHVRFNYKSTDLCAAVGLAQAAKLPDFIRRRRELARLYDLLLAGLPWIERPDLAIHAESVYYRYVVKVPAGRRDALRAAMAEAGIECGLGVLHPLHRLMPQAVAEPCPVAEDWARRSLSLPIYPQLSDEQAHQVVHALRRCGESFG
jgi:dTDP-4-amino-4,6-dideoxygalactose transaminase